MAHIQEDGGLAENRRGCAYLLVDACFELLALGRGSAGGSCPRGQKGVQE